MAMVELKRTEAELRKEHGIEPGKPLPDYIESDYTYGLTLRLGPMEMQKLGLSGTTAGKEMVVSCRVRVTEVGSAERGGELREHMALQVEAMDIPAEKTPRPASSLYETE